MQMILFCTNFKIYFLYFFCFLYLLLRTLRNLRALCVQKILYWFMTTHTFELAHAFVITE
jgi:hypothetical protein